MSNAKDLVERARMFDECADRARDPISRQHYREMAADYRSISVEHQEAGKSPGANWSTEIRTSDDHAPICGVPNAGLSGQG
jgi:hypothetical protein